jgi:hypothetical protein
MCLKRYSYHGLLANSIVIVNFAMKTAQCAKRLSGGNIFISYERQLMHRQSQLRRLRKRITSHQQQTRREYLTARRAGQQVTQEKDRWPSDWKPLTIRELMDR